MIPQAYTDTDTLTPRLLQYTCTVLPDTRTSNSAAGSDAQAQQVLYWRLIVLPLPGTAPQVSNVAECVTGEAQRATGNVLQGRHRQLGVLRTET